MTEEEIQQLFTAIKEDLQRTENYNFKIEDYIDQNITLNRMRKYATDHAETFRKAKAEKVEKNRHEHSKEVAEKVKAPAKYAGLLLGLGGAYYLLNGLHWGLQAIGYAAGAVGGWFAGPYAAFMAARTVVYGWDWAKNYEGDISSIVKMHIGPLMDLTVENIKGQIAVKQEKMRAEAERNTTQRKLEAERIEAQRMINELQNFSEADILSALNMEDEAYVDAQLEHVTDPVNYHIITDPVSVEGRNFDRETLQNIWNMHGLQAVTPFTRARLENPKNIPSHIPTRENIANLDNMQPTTFREKVLKSRYEHAKQEGNNPYFG